MESTSRSNVFSLHEVVCTITILIWQSNVDVKSVLYGNNDDILSMKKLVELYDDKMKDTFLLWLILQILRKDFILAFIQ